MPCGPAPNTLGARAGHGAPRGRPRARQPDLRELRQHVLRLGLEGAARFCDHFLQQLARPLAVTDLAELLGQLELAGQWVPPAGSAVPRSRSGSASATPTSGAPADAGAGPRSSVRSDRSKSIERESLAVAPWDASGAGGSRSGSSKARGSSTLATPTGSNSIEGSSASDGAALSGCVVSESTGLATAGSVSDRSRSRSMPPPGGAAAAAGARPGCGSGMTDWGMVLAPKGSAGPSATRASAGWPPGRYNAFSGSIWRPSSWARCHSSPSPPVRPYSCVASTSNPFESRRLAYTSSSLVRMARRSGLARMASLRISSAWRSRP